LHALLILLLYHAATFCFDAGAVDLAEHFMLDLFELAHAVLDHDCVVIEVFLNTCQLAVAPTA